MIDVTDWELIGYGEDSTLEKEELKNKEGEQYLIKYPRVFEVGSSWEDVTEKVAAQTGTLLGLDMMKVQIVFRNNRRGCLLRNFVDDYKADNAFPGAFLLQAECPDMYKKVQERTMKGTVLMEYAFEMLSNLSVWKIIKKDFIYMILFDLVIGNQDRHPYNWSLLYRGDEVMMSPLYDNGAALGFRFEDEKIEELLKDQSKRNKYYKNTKVKFGLCEKSQVKMMDLYTFLYVAFYDEVKEFNKKIENFDFNSFSHQIEENCYLSRTQKKWLNQVIVERIEVLTQLFQEREG